MKTLQEIQCELEEVEKQLQSLESTRDKVEELKRSLSALSPSPASPPAQSPPLTVDVPPEMSAPYRQEPKTYRYPPSRMSRREFKKPEIKKPRFHINEGNIGRYGLGILASLLILLAVITIASTFWQYVPNILKFLFFMGLGVGCEAYGYFKLKDVGLKNGFWTSIMGLGAAMSFVTIILGESPWLLYPSLSTVIFMLGWFLVNFFLATSMNSKVFYTIAYIGGILSTLFTLTMGKDNLSRDIIVVIITFVIYGMGKLGDKKTKNPALPILNMGLLCAVFCQIESILDVLRYTEYGETLVSVHIPYCLIVLQLVVSALILIEAGKLWRNEWTGSGIIQTILIFLASYWVALSCHNFLRFFFEFGADASDSLMSAMTLGMFLLCAVFYRKSLCRYILGTTPMTVMALSSLSRMLFEEGHILPAIFAFMLVISLNVRKDKYMRAAAVLAYFLAFRSTYFAGSPTIYASSLGCICLLCVPIVHYALMYVLQDGIFPEVEQLGCIVFTALASRRFFDLFEVKSEMLWVLVLSALSLANRYLAHGKQLSQSKDEKSLARVISLVIMGWVCFCCYTGGLFNPNSFDKGIITLLLTTYSALSVCKTVKSRSYLTSILSVIFCNWNIFYVTEMWNSGTANILVSLYGLLLSALFIAVGFWKKQKPARITGLIVMIVYVLKIALFDLSQSGDPIRQVFVLLLGGLVCFGVSFAYNKLDKLYGQEEPSTSEQGNSNI